MGLCQSAHEGQTALPHPKNIDWHTLRHPFGTFLKANGEDVKTGRELLERASSRITLDAYTQPLNSEKRATQGKPVQMRVPNPNTNGST
ncbi:hypothetical protein GRAN_0244 [Granulicella sibirica]|uniref:Tyr recombinase domain-containing protein n=1 Tax=Granulicella sibirica TaxID=2479048 RepID=A0A4V1L5U0_9BACT|nr:hypothetical protein GRAN_0244 [Granulicella sibirica]